MFDIRNDDSDPIIAYIDDIRLLRLIQSVACSVEDEVAWRLLSERTLESVLVKT